MLFATEKNIHWRDAKQSVQRGKRIYHDKMFKQRCSVLTPPPAAFFVNWEISTAAFLQSESTF